MSRHYFLIIVLFITSCATANSGHGQFGLKKMSPEENRACKMKNGTVTPGYLEETCVYPTSDAGKVCFDSKECEAGCIAPKGSRQGDEVSGVCRDMAGLAGCTNWVWGGQASGEICAD